jgi:aminoglycoside 2''-phosphotransferase
MANKDQKRLKRLLPRIHELAPDLEVRKVEYNDQGLMNEIAIINDDLVFRFARDAAAALALQAELTILNHLRQYLSLPIPTPFASTPCSAAYHMLPGDTLSREVLAGLDSAEVQALAEQTGIFLSELHSAPLLPGLPRSPAPVTPEAWLKIQRRTRKLVYPLLLPHQLAAVERFFERLLGDPGMFDSQPALIHGDLGPYHLLYDSQARRLAGVIDFGVAGLGDPANDLALLLHYYGERFVQRMLEVYPQAAEVLPRARLYARGLELEWVIKGLRSGETFWFTAHLTAARDLDGWE